MELKQALETIVSENPDGFAVSYAKSALTMGGAEKPFEVEWEGKTTIKAITPDSTATGEMMKGEYLKTQLKHVLNNLSGWDNEEVKTVLKDASK